MKKTLMLLLPFLLLLLSSCAKPTPSGQEAEQTNRLGLSWQEQYDLGMRYLAEGSYREAVVAFTAAIEIDPKRYEAYAGRAGAYSGPDSTEEELRLARADYDAALSLNSDDAALYLGAADICARLGDEESMLTYLDTGYARTEASSIREAMPKFSSAYYHRMLNLLSNQYGFFASPQTGTGTETPDKWLKPEGLLAASIADFDTDDEDELIAFCAEPAPSAEGRELDPHELAATLYELRDGEVVPAGRTVLCRLSANAAGYWDLQVTLMHRTSDGCYLLCELTTELNDCTNYSYWIISCDDGLQRVASLDGIDYSFVTYEGSVYQDDEIVETRLWFGDEDYVDATGEQSLYESFPEAATAFFEKYGVRLEDTEHLDYYRYYGDGLFAGAGRELMLHFYISRNQITYEEYPTVYRFTAVNESAAALSELLHPTSDGDEAALRRAVTGMWCAGQEDTSYVLDLRADGSCDYYLIYTKIQPTGEIWGTGSFWLFDGTWRVVGRSATYLDIALYLKGKYAEDEEEGFYSVKLLWRMEPISDDFIRISNLGTQLDGVANDGSNFYSAVYDSGYRVVSETWYAEQKELERQEAERERVGRELVKELDDYIRAGKADFMGDSAEFVRDTAEYVQFSIISDGMDLFIGDIDKASRTVSVYSIFGNLISSFVLP